MCFKLNQHENTLLFIYLSYRQSLKAGRYEIVKIFKKVLKRRLASRKVTPCTRYSCIESILCKCKKIARKV